MKKRSTILLLACLSLPLISQDHLSVSSSPGQLRISNKTLTANAPALAPESTFASIDTKISLLLEAERSKLPVEGTLLYDCTDLENYGFSSANGATRQIIDADPSMEFGKKFQVNVKVPGTNPWEPQLTTPKNTIPVNKGDMLFYVLFIRSVDTDQPNDFGDASFFCQRSSSPWTTIGSLSMALTTHWQKYYVAAKAETDFGIEEMLGTFHLGQHQQVLEIGGIIALNLGQNINLADLPTNKVTYYGMEEDAPWRAEADQRIRQYRKGQLTIEVNDADGEPVENANVAVQMTDHSYEFGTFMSDLALESSSDASNYRNHITEMFNNATTPFYMGGNTDNWGWYGSASAKTNYPKLAQWLQMVGLSAKGHVLIWPGWRNMPSYFEDLSNDPEGLEAAINDHLELLVPIGKEYGLQQWDVVNEPYKNHDVMDILGEDILVDWYQKVHELDSIPELIFNEYNIVMNDGDPNFQANFERLIQFLIDEGAPLDGIGVQCHFGELLTGIPQILEILDRFDDFNLPIQITEFDVSIRDQEVKAAYLRDFYTAVYSHPSTNKIVMWGFYEDVMWKPLAALVNTDWSHNLNYEAYMDLLYEQWWTDSTGTTDEQGSFDLLADHGIYDLTVSTPDTVYYINSFVLSGDTSIALHPPLDTMIQEGIFDSGRRLFEIRNFPNPFSSFTRIDYTVERPADISITLYNNLGKAVKSIVNGYQNIGRYSIRIDSTNLEPGIYHCVYDCGAGQANKRGLVMIRE